MQGDCVQLGAPGMKPSVRVGEAALREVAAYLLDYDGFAGIPPACLVLCRHDKLNYTYSVTRIESMADLAMLPGPPGHSRHNSNVDPGALPHHFSIPLSTWNAQQLHMTTEHHMHAARSLEHAV